MARKDIEGLEQKQFTKLMNQYYPKVLWTISIAGVNLNAIKMVNLKRKGFSPGTPDIWIMEPVGKYHGLVIELKPEKSGKVTDSQIMWVEELNKRGYYARVIHGAYLAFNTVAKYLSARV